MLRILRLNTGSCGGCDVELDLAVAAPHAELAWATSPADADLIVLTGPITIGVREMLMGLLKEAGDIPIVALGRCALDGHPFGRGGVQEFPTITATLRLDGCPPDVGEIAKALVEVGLR